MPRLTPIQVDRRRALQEAVQAKGDVADLRGETFLKE